MKEQYISDAARELGLRSGQVEAVVKLLGEGATVPFIARYRKEATGSLDEVAVIAVRDRLEEIEAIEKRRGSILESLRERELLNPELERKISAAARLNELEDIYLPYRPKRKTRASAAREKGLGPLAEMIIHYGCTDPFKAAEVFTGSEMGVDDPESAVSGASDIIAEKAAENPELRSALRRYFERNAVLSASLIKKKADQALKYTDYFNYSEPLSKVPAHRFLAVMRGSDEGCLKSRIYPEKQKFNAEAVRLVMQGILRENEKTGKSNKACDDLIKNAVKDSCDRLIGPSLETEFRSSAKKEADMTAIGVFAGNVRNLLLAPPLGGRSMIALDPGLRTGCKLVVLSAEGDLLYDSVIYPLPPHNKTDEAAAQLLSLAEKYGVEAVAVGNGTGGREAEAFAREIFSGSSVMVEQVNESGASVYSASEAARREFPDKDVTVRGAVSIGRRLMDPLAELVKIDPKSIGVGQYQHDVDQKLLKKSLDDVVVSCVNSVGVELNTASLELLSYVSGLGRGSAANIVKRRSDSAFTDISQLLDVPGVGARVFQQAAGFLRISGGNNPLDAGAVHPESYHIVERMAEKAGVSLAGLIGSSDVIAGLNPDDFVTETAGLPTVMDIIAELLKPGRDPRPPFTGFSFAEGVSTMADLREGMLLNGIVTNVTAFGAFVDIGVHQDGLVHISEISESYVKDPADFLSVNLKVRVRVLAVDERRRRISLSMKGIDG